MSERLMAQLDGARLVRYDTAGYVLAWYGGQSTGIHVYAASGAEAAYWQVEQPRSGDVDSQVVFESMSAWLNGERDA